MAKAQLYFLTNSYYSDFPDPNLLKNKAGTPGKKHDRPCFVAFEDKTVKGIFWVIPVSSRVKKYKSLAAKKKKQHGKCDTICFGKIHGRESAFLIQNMCPVTRRYMIPYVDKYGKPVAVDARLAKKLASKAKKILILASKGKNFIFPDVFAIYAALSSKQK